MTSNKHDQYAQLEVAFGKNRAKQILAEIKELKKQNPDRTYSFIFAENGTFEAVEKEASKKDAPN